MRDLHNNIAPKRAISPVSVSDNTAQVGQWVDRYGYEALEFVVLIGSVADADATFTVLVEDADASDKSDAAAVADAYLLGTEALAGFQYDSDNALRKIGYVGSKRYVRVTVTPSNNSGAAVIGAVGVLGAPMTGPTANPPA